MSGVALAWGIFEITQRSAPGLQSPPGRPGTPPAMLSIPSYEGQKRGDSVNKTWRVRGEDVGYMVKRVVGGPGSNVEEGRKM